MASSLRLSQFLQQLKACGCTIRIFKQRRSLSQLSLPFFLFSNSERKVSENLSVSLCWAGSACLAHWEFRKFLRILKLSRLCRRFLHSGFYFRSPADFLF